MRTLPIAVLISGGGTNLQALIDACADAKFPAEIKLVLSNRPKAGGLDRAKKAGIPTAVVDHKDFDTREEFESALQSVLEASDVELICLAGFMRILNGSFVNNWKDRMINIHPSLLPSFKGLHTHERAIESGVRFAGCTVHYVRAEMDDGPIIIQAVVPIDADETPDSLAAKVLTYEHQIYPESLRLIANRLTRVRGHRVMIDHMPVPKNGLINPIPE